MNRHIEELYIALQRLLPQHSLSRLLGKVAESEIPWLKNALIRTAVRHYGIDMADAQEEDPAHYTSFNRFFTRALKPDARPLEGGDNTLVSPADGTLSQFGTIDRGQIFQAKGHTFSTRALLGCSEDRAAGFDGGSFATIYLAPRDYHRVHMPLAGELTECRYIPGRLFSVNEVTARGVPGLFARNERLVCHFDTAAGPMAVVLVGAIFVAGIRTPWREYFHPRQCREEQFNPPRPFARGEELGQFCFGSTVIVAMAEGCRWREIHQPGNKVRMGQALST